MEESGYLCLVISLATLTQVFAQVSEPTVVINPAKSLLMVSEGSPFNLTCVAKYNKDNPQTVSMYKIVQGAAPVKVNMYSPRAKEDSLVREETSVYIDLNAATADQGRYECRLAPRGTTSALQLYVYTLPELENGIITPKTTELKLTCDLGTSESYDYEVTWEWNGVTIKEEAGKYKLTATTLEIVSPTRDNVGEYVCKVTFFPNERPINQQMINAGTVFVGAPPKIESHSKDHTTLSQDDDLALTCKVSGYPIPTLKWFKGESELEESDRVRFQKYEGLDNGKVIVDNVDYADKGAYTCIASNTIEPFNATAIINVKVKDKLAALWPFLGILAEVIVLVLIILWSNKQKKKEDSDEDEADDTDSKPLTSGATNSGVRSRNI